MKYIQDIENQEHLKEFVLQDLKEKYGLKIPKGKKNKTRDDSLELGRNIFGNHLCLMPCVYVDNCGPVPKFLVEASQLLEKHANTEGLFRKSGSVARQKELKQKIEIGEDLNDANPLDLGSLLKQFFRELPDPLLTSRHHDIFIRAFSLDPEARKVRAMLLLCLILPWHHLCVLRYMMIFLKSISAHCDSNKMDVQNLAVCLAPNLLYSSMKSDRLNMSESKLLQIQTNIVQLLINHSESIGMVCDTLVERTTLMGSLFPSEDELDRSDAGHNDSKSSKKKKKRSASFQGIMSNLSSSFSKWRKDTKNHHNASNVSERSGYSFSSVADKSSVLIPDHPDSLAYLEALGYPEMTPKMIRKRKAEDEVVPFSASKKQAILQSMPQMSTLGGTPFTPAVMATLR